MIDKDLPYCKDLVVSISIGWNNHIFTWEMGGSITESPYPLQELLGVGVPLVFLQVDTLKTRCNFGLALRNAGRRFFHRRIGFWWILVDEISTGNLHPCIQGGYLDFFFKRMVSRCEGSLLFFFWDVTCKKNVPAFVLQTSRWIIIQSNWLVAEKSRWLYFSAFSSSCQLKPTKPTDQKSPTQRRPCEAEAELRATWQSLQRVMGSRHPLSLTTLQILGVGWWI